MKNNKVMKKILLDSFGGILYDLNNVNKYDTKGLLKEWELLTELEKNAEGGIIKGAINFIKGN